MPIDRTQAKIEHSEWMRRVADEQVAKGKWSGYDVFVSEDNPRIIDTIVPHKIKDDRDA